MPLAYRRILLKISGEMCQGVGPGGIDPLSLQQIAEFIKPALKQGVQISMVVGGGNLCRGETLTRAHVSQAKADQIGMLATVMNGLALGDVLVREGIPARVFSAMPIVGVVAPFCHDDVMRALSLNEVVIFVAGTGNPYFTTDTAASLRAIQIGADLLLKATKVDGVFDRDPKLHADAARFSHITYEDVITRQLRVMDLTAICLCRDHRLPVRVADFSTPQLLTRLLQGESLGTLISEKPHD